MNASIARINGYSGFIADTTSCTGSGYENMTALSCTLQAGATYTATLALSASYYSGFAIQVWIDFDNDGTFQASEVIGGGGVTSSGGTAFAGSYPVISLTTPSSVAAGTYRMRMVNNYSCCGASFFPGINPCPTTAISYGDVRDYTIVMVGAAPVLSGTPASVTFPPTTSGTSSAGVNAVVGGSYLTPTTGAITVASSSAAFEVYNGSSWASSYAIAYTSSTVSLSTVQVRFSPTAVTSYSANLVVSGGGASSVLIPLNGAGATICSGTPTAGAASVSPSTGSSVTTFTLTVTGYSASSGLTFQWQSRNPSATGSWVNITGATSTVYSFTGMPSTSDYQCIVTCSASGISATSAAVTATLGMPPAACTPLSGVSCSSYYPSFSRIGNLVGSAGAITDTFGCTGYVYADFSSSMSCYLIGGVSYNATLNLSSSYYSSQSVQIWIDFNDDGAFQSSETAGGITYPSTPNPVVTLAIPSGIAPGARRMRIVGNYVCCGYSIYPYINPCPSSAASYAFARDYGVNLTAGSPYGVISPASISFSPTSAGTTSTAMVGVFNGTYLTPASGNLTVTASSNFSVCSTSAGTYASSYTLAYTGAAVSANNIYIKFNAPSTSGYYTGTVCVSGGGLSAPVCSSLSGSSVISLGMPDMQEADLQVYPNPATTELYITTCSTAGSGISITNSVGAEAMRQPISAGETRLNIKGLPAGVYCIRLTGTVNNILKKFVKL